MQVIFNRGFDMCSIFDKKIGSLFLLFLSVSLNASSDDLFMPLIDKADKARVEFNELYKYFLEHSPEVLSDSNEIFSNNFKLKPNISGRILDNGPVLLNLISWLDKNKKDDPVGLLLLRKLNRFLYLEFRHFVGHLKVNKKYEGRLVGLLHNFYKFKVPAKLGSAEEKLKYEFPFQATVSRAMLFILIVNASSLNYDEKVENVAYFLDKMRRELLEIKSRYSDDCNLRTADVSDFVELLQTYAAKEPILGPNYLKRILIISLVIGLIALVIWIVWTKVVPNWDDILDYSGNRAHEMYARIIDPWADRIADKMSKKIYDMPKINAVLELARLHGNRFEAEVLNRAHEGGVVLGVRQVVQHPVAVPPLPTADELADFGNPAPEIPAVDAVPDIDPSAIDVRAAEDADSNPEDAAAAAAGSSSQGGGRWWLFGW
jgi:hypothetical protein